MLQTIAPAPNKNSCKSSVLGMNSINLPPQTQNQSHSTNQNSGYNKKKFTYANMPFGQQPVSVVRRNARERNRVKQVNNGFVTLRQHIPQNIIQTLSNGGRGPHKKLSKVDTLRLAVEYIRRLQDLVTDTDGKSPSSLTSTLSDFASSGFDQMLASPSSETSSYYTASPEPSISSPLHHQQQQPPQHHQIYSNSTGTILLHNTSLESHTNQSEASISPAPSYISESSSLSPSSMPNYGYGLNSKINLTPLSSVVTGSNGTATTTSLNYSLNQFKYEPYDDYSSQIHQSQQHHHHYHNNNHHHSIVETATTSEDEELLDYISMWQEEQQQQQQQ